VPNEPQQRRSAQFSQLKAKTLAFRHGKANTQAARTINLQAAHSLTHLCGKQFAICISTNLRDFFAELLSLFFFLCQLYTYQLPGHVVQIANNLEVLNSAPRPPLFPFLNWLSASCFISPWPKVDSSLFKNKFNF